MGKRIIVKDFSLKILVTGVLILLISISAKAKNNYEFIDERMVEHTFLLERLVNPLTKYADNPVIKNANGVCGVVQKKGQPVKIFYVGRYRIAGEPLHGGRIPLGERTLRYAETADGFTMSFPELNLVSYRGSKKNNVIISKGVCDDSGIKLYDSEKRGFGELPCIIDSEKLPYAKGKYTMFMRMLHRFFYSQDGFVWKAYKEAPLKKLQGSDTYNNFLFDPASKSYFLYHRPDKTLHAGQHQTNRLVALVTSKDLIKWDWAQAKCVLDTDLRDAAAIPKVTKDIYRSRGRDLQFERMTVSRYNDFFIGLAVILDNTREGHYATHLLHSYDGINWIREADRNPFIEPSSFGHWDSGMAGSIPSGCPVEIGDKLIFYYMGSNMTHNYVMKNKQRIESRNIGAGYIKKGRFIAYKADNVKGELLTRPFILTDKTIFLNAKVPKGKIKLGIMQADGKPINGFNKDNCIAITGDGLELAVKWKGKRDLAGLIGKNIRLRIEVDNGSIYGFKIK
jgi:hypothetical protein